MSDIRPSTPITTLLNNSPDEFLHLTLGLLPELPGLIRLDIESASGFREWKAYGNLWMYLLLTLWPSILGLLFGTGLGVIVSIGILVAILFIHQVVPTQFARVRLDGICTFRDLSERIALLHTAG
ncbi:MAG: hypothetical protein R3C11_04995 [Planctomycetaceae bacterium]